MNQTIRQHRCIGLYVVTASTARPDVRLPDAPWPTLHVVPKPQPTWLQRLNERLWQIHDHGMGLIWAAIAIVMLLIDVGVVLLLLTGPKP